MKIVFIILLSSILTPLRGQHLAVVDVVAGRMGYIFDFMISPDGKRYYSISTARDTIILNQIPIIVDPFITSLDFGKSYLLSVNEDGSSNFFKYPSGRAFALKGESLLSCWWDHQDTVLTSDTLFLKKGPPVSNNLYILEHSSEGVLVRAKQFAAKYESRYSVTEAVYKSGHLFVSGEFSNDTLSLDSLTLPTKGSQDGFVASFDVNMNSEWIIRMGGQGDDYCPNVAVNDQGRIAAAGSLSSYYLYACEDTVTNMWGWNTNALYFLLMDSAGQCQRLESCYGNHPLSSVSAWDVQWLDDDHILCSGIVNSPELLIGGVPYQNNSANGTGFILKAGYDDKDFEVLMLTGNNYQSIESITTSAQGDIWICGRYGSDTLGIGPFKLPHRGPGTAGVPDGFIAKLNKNLQPLYAASIGGNDTDLARIIKRGPDNEIYLMMQTYSKKMDINGEPFYKKTYYRDEHIIVRIKDTLSVGTPEIISNKPNVKIYPNPADVSLEVRMESIQSETDIELTDLFGTVLRRSSLFDLASASIETATLPSGIYLLRIKSPDQRAQTQKVIIQH